MHRGSHWVWRTDPWRHNRRIVDISALWCVGRCAFGQIHTKFEGLLTQVIVCCCAGNPPTPAAVCRRLRAFAWLNLYCVYTALHSAAAPHGCLHCSVHAPPFPWLRLFPSQWWFLSHPVPQPVHRLGKFKNPLPNHPYTFHHCMKSCD